ncbi:hypothetical protein [Micromonospora sp. NPDC047134]|uniref:hypothetical protein n=1 Tax=Micromonospora sp. NPDC047134 TaxID=3154340 RepID=UPI0033C2B3D7
MSTKSTVTIRRSSVVDQGLRLVDPHTRTMVDMGIETHPPLLQMWVDVAGETAIAGLTGGSAERRMSDLRKPVGRNVEAGGEQAPAVVEGDRRL